MNFIIVLERMSRQKDTKDSHTTSASTFLSKFLKVLLNSAGIGLSWQCEKFRLFLSLLKYYLLISFILTTSFQIVLLKDCRSMNEFSLTLAYVFSGFFLNVATLILHLKKQHMFTILDMVERDIPAIMSTSKYTISASEKFEKFFFSHAVKFYIVYGFACMSPFLFFPISGKKIGDLNTLLIPSWFPWQIDSVSVYILTVGLQFVWLVPLSVPVLLNFTFVVYFTLEVKVQHEILCDKISKVVDEFHYNKHDDRIIAKFKKCIQHHQMILKFVRNFCSCFKWLFTADLIYSLANLSLLLYSIVSGEKTISAFMQQFSAFVLVFSILYSYCYIGETLRNANDYLEKCLYNIEWYEQSVKFRKLFHIFTAIIQLRVNLKAGSGFIASRELFSGVLKLAYSYFNLLNTTF